MKNGSHGEMLILKDEASKIPEEVFEKLKPHGNPRATILMVTTRHMCERCGFEAKVVMIRGLKYWDCPECGKYKTEDDHSRPSGKQKERK